MSDKLVDAFYLDLKADVKYSSDDQKRLILGMLRELGVDLDAAFGEDPGNGYVKRMIVKINGEFGAHFRGYATRIVSLTYAIRDWYNGLDEDELEAAQAVVTAWTSP